MKTHRNDMAFPGSGGPDEYWGLTKREYFAVAAMQGAIAADPHGDLTPEEIARDAVRYADAIIAELNK